MSFPVKYSELNNRVIGLDLADTITTAIWIYQLKRSTPKLIIEVACKDLASKVFITFRNSEELIQNGYADRETAEGKKRKYHIKLFSDQITACQILGMFLLTQLNQSHLIKHKCALVVQNATAEKEKQYSDLRIQLKDSPQGPVLEAVHLNALKK